MLTFDSVYILEIISVSQLLIALEAVFKYLKMSIWKKCGFLLILKPTHTLMEKY